jgi:DNA-binding transcriptional LysR family regulator
MSFRRGHLRYFVTVAQEGQITRAAAKLHIAQPALSHAIAQLESELGVQLLERHPRGVTLTAAGEAFLPKAREALAKAQEATVTAQALARGVKGVVELGFIGPPPAISMPQLLAAFARMMPEAEVSLHDLPFPRGSTVSWLADVDLALCHPPALERGIGVQAVRCEPRALMMTRSHPLAQLEELTLADVLDETFVSYHPDVQPEWAGFHSLDDHRGGPPRSMTVDHAASTLQMLGIMTTSDAVTVVPQCDARIAQQVLPEVVATPVRDARPAVLSLVWDTGRQHPLAEGLVAVAAELAEVERDGGVATDRVEPLV